MFVASDGARLVGYARVSTQDQDLALQIDALLKYGVAKELIFTDRASGATHQRPGLETCLAQLRDGDVLLVWRLDRFPRVRNLAERQTTGQRRPLVPQSSRDECTCIMLFRSAPQKGPHASGFTKGIL